MEIYERNIALEWYKYGLEKGDDFFIKFMMHWVAFNWFYNQYEGEKEWQRIRKFCEKNIQRLQKFDAFSNPAMAVFRETAVGKGHTGVGKIQKIRFEQMNTNHSIPDLIETMYQVRCNLFHGSKSLRVDRDIELVKSSSVLLEGYLKAILFDK